MPPNNPLQRPGVDKLRARLPMSERAGGSIVIARVEGREGTQSQPSVNISQRAAIFHLIDHFQLVASGISSAKTGSVECSSWPAGGNQ